MNPEVYLEMAAIQDRHWWFVARRRILNAVIREMVLPPRTKILEVGCGTGGNLAMLAEFGELIAVECDEGARSFANTLGLCPVVEGGLPDSLPFADNRFDLICLFDVLEHVKDDAGALSRTRSLLRRSGRLLVTVPAYPWLWSAHDEAHQHHRRYTSKTLRVLARESGFDVIRCGYFNSFLFPLILGHRVASKLFLGGERSDAALPLPWINAALREGFSLERHFLNKRSFPFGASILAVLAPSS